MNLVDYHIHTPLCGHAEGAVEDYISFALKNNLSEIGFSDHFPLPDDLREGITMAPSQVEAYISLIEEAKENFEGRIMVKTGFEIDYPLHGSFSMEYLSDERIDYLIGSCHFIGAWAFDHPDNVSEFDRRDINQVYSEYYALIEGLAGSGLFNIVGHFDVVKKFGHRPTEDFLPVIEGICGKLSANGVAVEINTAGLRKPVGEIYPSRDIIDLFFRMNVPVTLGSDAHTPEETAYRFDLAAGILKKTGYRKISGFSRRKRYDIFL